MSTIDIGTTESPLSRPQHPRAAVSPVAAPVDQKVDDGDFYIGSTKINTLPPLHTAVASRRTTNN